MEAPFTTCTPHKQGKKLHGGTHHHFQWSASKVCIALVSRAWHTCDQQSCRAQLQGQFQPLHKKYGKKLQEAPTTRLASKPCAMAPFWATSRNLELGR